jgi:isoleucyl-tRNA synthetase
MDAVRELVSAALSVRKAKGLRVRLPLPSLTVATPDADALRPFADLVADEVNVKSVEFAADVDAYSRQVLTVVPRALGPRIGGAVQQVIKAVKAGDWSLVDGAPVAAGVTLLAGEYELRLVAADADNSAPLPGNAGVVVLDTTVTPALAAEGLARDVVRVVQQARRDAHLDVSDRVAVVVAGGDGVRSAVAEHRDFVAREVLASTIDLTEGDLDGFEGEVGVGERITVTVTRV